MFLREDDMVRQVCGRTESIAFRLLLPKVYSEVGPIRTVDKVFRLFDCHCMMHDEVTFHETKLHSYEVNLKYDELISDFPARWNPWATRSHDVDRSPVDTNVDTESAKPLPGASLRQNSAIFHE
jgi:hypothetical protein